MAVVYQHKKLNGDIFYIGIASNKRRPYSKLGRSEYWKRIINKYDYTVEILYKNLTWEEACNIEINLIKQYGRLNNKTGILVNMTDGGEGRNNSKHSKETLIKLSKAKLGKKLSDETKSKMSKNSYRLRKVIDTSTNIIYNSLKEISELFNIKPSTLSHYLNGSRTNKTTFKYI